METRDRLDAEPLLAGVLLVEDEPNALGRCLQIVDEHPRLTLTASATGFRKAVALVENPPGPIDLLLTDLQLGDGDGADLIQLCRSRHGSKAMVVSVFGDVASVIRAVEAGADGYLLKSGSNFEMMTAISTVLDGGAPISAAVAGHLLRRIRHAARRPHGMLADRVCDRESMDLPLPQLSERETDVLKDLARGLSYKEVARNLGISPFTVGDHVKKIYRKLAVNSRSEAVFEAVRGGLIDLSNE